VAGANGARKSLRRVGVSGVELRDVEGAIRKGRRFDTPQDGLRFGPEVDGLGSVGDRDERASTGKAHQGQEFAAINGHAGRVSNVLNVHHNVVTRGR
jgi:hypothetical protein